MFVAAPPAAGEARSLGYLYNEGYNMRQEIRFLLIIFIVGCIRIVTVANSETSDQDKDTPFRQEHLIVREFALSDGTQLRLIVESIEEQHHLIKIGRGDNTELLLYDEDGYAYMDRESFHITELPGSPSLWLFEWQTEPEGQGRYRARYYVIVAVGNLRQLLVKGWVSSGNAGALTWGDGTYRITYTANTLRIEEQYVYQQATFKPKNTGYWLTLGESLLVRTYHVHQQVVELVQAEQHGRQVNGDEQQEMDLSAQLEAAAWTITTIPNEQAEREYPAINTTHFY